MSSEREMSRQQCLMVDQCFEEGQYESGIDVLDQLRSNEVRPSPAHIRQLLYIALLRSSATTSTQNKGKERMHGEFTVTPFASPTKVAPKREPKTSFKPSAKASEAARRLLSSYAMTVSPESLIRAIPRYNFTDAETACLPRPLTLDGSKARIEEDSVIAQKSVTLLECACCWNLLKPGVVKTGSAASWTLQVSGKVVEDGCEDKGEETESVVADTAWPILAWLVDLFEKDESLVEADNSKARYSGLLFSQIKPSDGSLLRSNADEPVEIAVACYEESDIRRHTLGQRLMRLLVNLTACPLFSALRLVECLNNHLSSSSTAILSDILSDLPSTTRGAAFKAAVCDKMIGRSLGALQQQGRKVRTTLQKTGTEGVPGSPSKAASQSALQRMFTFPVPTMTKVMDLLSSFQQKQTRTSIDDFVILFHLVTAAGNLASQHDGKSDGDRAWTSLVKGDQLENVVVDTFSGKGREHIEEHVRLNIDEMGTVLKMKCEVWRRSLACPYT